MFSIDKLIYALEIARDNAQARDGHVSAEDVAQIIARADLNPNHDREIDARMGDDLRKLAHYTNRFRQACVEFSLQHYKKHDPNDPDRFRRCHRQMIETGRDITNTLSHINPEIR